MWVTQPLSFYLYSSSSSSSRVHSAEQQLQASGTLRACPSPRGGSQWGTPAWAVEQAVSFC